MTDHANIQRRFLKSGLRLKVDASALDHEEAQLISRYGHWLDALANGRLQPITTAQIRFLSVHRGEVEALSAYERA